MLSIMKQFKISSDGNLYSYLSLMTQVFIISFAVVLLFEAIWSASLLLPLSIGVEILAKILISHAIKFFIHKN